MRPTWTFTVGERGATCAAGLAAAAAAGLAAEEGLAAADGLPLDEAAGAGFGGALVGEGAAAGLHAASRGIETIPAQVRSIARRDIRADKRVLESTLTTDDLHDAERDTGMRCIT
jgi:hypothetical protein